MSTITKIMFAAIFGLVVCVGAAQAADWREMNQIRDFNAPDLDDGGDEVFNQTVAPGEAVNSNDDFGKAIPRSEALYFAQPETDGGMADVVDQPSLGRGGVVSDPKFSAPDLNTEETDGRDQSVLGR